jgi:hypothetical protein
MEVDMSRDHRKLRVFHDAHRLTLAIYKEVEALCLAEKAERRRRAKNGKRKIQTQDPKA